MKHSFPHDLSVPTAKAVADAACASYQEKLPKNSIKLVWQQSTDKVAKAEVSFSVGGTNIKGTLEVQPKLIVMDLNTPFLFRQFEPEAINVVKGEIDAWIAKAKTGEI